MSSTQTASHASCYHIGYSLNCAEYDDLLAIARGCCMLCKRPAAPLCLDHDHKLGWWAVRGIVCRSCNQRLRRVESGERAATDAIARYLADPWHLHQPNSAAKKARMRPRAECARCGQEIAVHTNGRLWHHWLVGPWGERRLCAGSSVRLITPPVPAGPVSPPRRVRKPRDTAPAVEFIPPQSPSRTHALTCKCGTCNPGGKQ